MDTKLYYFSGSGNSFNIAQNLNNKMENSKLISIPHAMKNSTNISGDIVGIICPIYFHNMPHIVRSFIKKMRDVKYLFMVYVGAGELGRGLKISKKLLAVQDIKLSSLFNITMPDNSTRYGEMSKENQQKLFNSADKKIDNIIEIVNKKEAHFDDTNTSLIKTYLHPGILFLYLHSSLKKMDKDFVADDKCNGCTTCQKVCPVNNITMKNNKPQWNQNSQCQVCLACHDWCPKESIKHPATNAKTKRYHNPNIKIKDIINSSVNL